MAAIGVDSGVRIHDLSSRDQQLVRRMIRSCVLSPRPAATSQSRSRRARRPWA
jgi:hypothetical protein